MHIVEIPLKLVAIFLQMILLWAHRNFSVCRKEQLLRFQESPCQPYLMITFEMCVGETIMFLKSLIIGFSFSTSHSVANNVIPTKRSKMTNRNLILRYPSIRAHNFELFVGVNKMDLKAYCYIYVDCEHF